MMSWRSGSRRAGLVLSLLAAAALLASELLPGAVGTTRAAPPAAPVTLPVTLTGGGSGGSQWIVRNDGGTFRTSAESADPAGGFCNGSPGLAIEDARLGTLADAFDNGLVLFVNNTVFAAPGQPDLTGQTLTAGPASLANLNVTVQHAAVADSATLRTLVSFQNTTASAHTASATLQSNLGLDTATTVRGTSSGGTTPSTADRWVVFDGGASASKPAVTRAFAGAGTVGVTPSSVARQTFSCSGREGLLVNYSVAVPANATRRLLVFTQLNTSSDAAVTAAVSTFNANPTAGSNLLSGLTGAQLGEIANFAIAVPTATPTVSTLAPVQNPPPTSGQAGVPCTTPIGGRCTITGAVSGTATKIASMNVTVNATGPANTAPSGTPAVFLPTTSGVESFACGAVPAGPPFTTTCTVRTTGDLLQNATVTVRFPLTTGGTQDVTGTATGANTGGVTVQQATALVAPSGPTGVACADQPGQTCQVAGAVSGTGTVTGSMTWNLTATAPAGVAAGVVPVAVFSTTAGVQGAACAALAAAGGTVTCVVPTGGNALLGSNVTVVFAAGVTAVGTVTGPGPGAGLGLLGLPPLLPLPILPPPPPLLPPPPLPPLGGPAASTGAPRPAFPEVPVIPETDSLWLLVGGLGALGALAAWRRRDD